MRDFLRDLAAIVFRPGALLGRSEVQARPLHGWVSALLLGAAYAALYAWLSNENRIIFCPPA